MDNVKITYLPPGRAEGSSFQAHANDRRLRRSTSEWITDSNLPADETPEGITLMDEFSRSALSLRDIIEEGD
jgi:hypothetical protein